MSRSLDVIQLTLEPGRFVPASKAGRLRVRGAGKKQEIVPVDEFVARVVREKNERSLTP